MEFTGGAVCPKPVRASVADERQIAIDIPPMSLAWEGWVYKHGESPGSGWRRRYLRVWRDGGAGPRLEYFKERFLVREPPLVVPRVAPNHHDGPVPMMICAEMICARFV
jgi:hypothetical protein